ncbi:RNA polymerase subunit sigma-70 [Catenulispora subtropica]|uniref:Sigma-70 family RNA polymerase sigma factor n=1 Tax=Catenulispora subtropica TaxID=450798 RepID=A0ABP5DPF6_9ACTN
MSAELLHRARSGDREAFAELVEPYRTELHLLCYRMLGSLQDAEDTLQEALLAAWMGLEGFEGRSSIRTWLHRITTNRCLNALRTTSRRPAAAVTAATPVAGWVPELSHLGEVPWLQPYPDLLLDGLPDGAPGPEARYEAREAVSLAFMTALQLLPPNQRAVLLLRDVFGYRAAEAADLLGLTESAVNSALKRARATLDASRSAEPPAPAPGSAQEVALTDRFVAAFLSHDVEALIALMTDDVWVRMPPLAFEYRGLDDARRFFAAVHPHRSQITHMVPTRANGHPAWGEYARDPVTGLLHCIGLLVVAYAGDRVRELTHFEIGIAAMFGLPRTMRDQGVFQ